jgi:hypothetical protein
VVLKGDKMADENGNCPSCGGNHGIVKTDGSGGVGERALLTLVTHDDIEGNKEETFEFPYALINFTILQAFCTFRQIMGYKLVRVPDEPVEGDNL